MANKVEIIVVAKDMTGAVFDNVERKAKAQGEKAGKEAGDGIKKGIEDSLKDANVGDLSAQFEKVGKDAGTALSSGIKDSFTAGNIDAHSWGVEIGTSIGDGVDDGLSKGGNGGGKSLLSRITGMASEALAAGKEIGSSIASGISDALSKASAGGSITTGLIAGLVAGAVAAAPLIAAALVGGIAAGGILTAGIGAAVLAAVTSPEIQEAGAQLGTALLGTLGNSVRPMVEPLLAAIQEVADKAVELAPVFNNMFGNLAEMLPSLSAAVLDFGESITVGLDSLIENAGPEVMSSLNSGIREVGDAVQYMLEKFGETEGAAEGLQGFFEVVAEAIVVVTDVLAFLSERFDEAVEKIRFFQDALDGIEGVEGQWVEMSEGATEFAEALGGVAAEAERAVDSLRALAEEQLAQIDPLVAYANAQEKVTEKTKAYNDAVREFGPASQEAANAGLEVVQALGQMEAAAGKATETFKGWTPEMEASARAAGLSQDKIDGLRGSVEMTYAEIEKVSKQWVIEIMTKGAEQAKSLAEGIGAAVQAIPSSKTVTINVVATGAVGLAGFRSGGSVGAQISKAATGGNRGNMVLVGEEGPEIVRLPFGSSVLPNGQTRRMMREERTQAKQDTSGPSFDMDTMIREFQRLGDRIERMQVVLDGRALGSIQGRDADLLYRAS